MTNQQYPQKYSDFDITNWDWPFRFPIMNMAATPSTEISVWEEEKEVVVEAATPGIKPEEVEMTFDKGVLLIRASKKEEKIDKAKKFYQKSNATFVYRVSVPGEIDEKHEPKATLHDGMLQVRFKKSERAIPKKINIQTNT